MSLRGHLTLQSGQMKEYMLSSSMGKYPVAEVQLRSVKSKSDPRNRQSWPMTPETFKQQLKDKEKLDHLTEILKRYNIHGLPPFPELLCLGHSKFDESMLEMETSWKIIVHNHQNLTKMQGLHQDAVWELLKTEVSKIRQIRVIIDVFQSCLINVQEESLLNEIKTEQIFGNIDEIFECNWAFWQRHLLPILSHSRQTGQPLNPILAKEGFVDHFPKMFQVYFKYFMSNKSCLNYVKTSMENNELFKMFIEWAESQEQCNRLKVLDILPQPVQMLCRYTLPLKAMYGYTEDEKDRSDIQAMIQSVEKLCMAANSAVKRKEQYDWLEIVWKTIDPFDAVETASDECATIMQEYTGKFNLLEPMPGSRDELRSLVFKSNLKMKEAQNTKVDVECLLFTDVLLICKSNKKSKSLKMIRPPMRLDKLVVSELKDKGSFLLIYLNEYSVPLSAFTFHSDSGPIQGWLEKFNEAQGKFTAMQSRKDAKLERLRSESTWPQNEVEVGLLPSATAYLEVDFSAIPRSGSANSLDRFLPNLPIADEKCGDSNHSEGAQSSPVGNIQRQHSSIPTQNYIPHAFTDSDLNFALRTDYSPFTEHIMYEESITRKGQSSLDRYNTVQTAQSFPNITGDNSNDTSKYVTRADNSRGFQDPKENHESQAIRLSPSNQLMNQCASFQSQTIEPGHTNSISKDEDLGKSKSNSRRTDKRYHTADEISDFKNTKKNSCIHKWSSLRMDVQTTDPMNLNSTMLSTASLQSFPSSSGVSSIGSLHNPLEMTEEQDWNNNDGSDFNGSYPIELEHHNHLSGDDTEDLDKMNDFVDAGSNQLFLSESNHSRSTSDLVGVFSSQQISQMTDGIASVAISTDGFNNMLSQRRRLNRIRQQILSDANIESSEV